MKTIVASALIAAAALAGLPATAQVAAGPAGAIAHFNLDRTNSEDLRLPEGRTAGTVVSTRSESVRAAVYDHFNGDADSSADLRGLNGATAFDATPAVGVDIVDRIRRESAESE
ncbi:hypothetical protein JSE7799_03428 [Jannaschia seosinensis]|uniref:Uncharacterized protein n=1 Tax=Jannaschia seosinensis TaxID=313367 RepID=A0A0M7BFK6_9RHOB|nr:hypothetical protein [Jannaschia seosinensis]CUH40693.1 hypothetical protein JSE7799_03428 [Jannaschia seosinensis]